MSGKKTTAEQESRAYREKLEGLTTNSSKDKQQIRTLDEALTKEEAEHNSQVVSLKSEIGRLEELVDSIRSKALTEVSGLDRSRGQVRRSLICWSRFHEAGRETGGFPWAQVNYLTVGLKSGVLFLKQFHKPK